MTLKQYLEKRKIKHCEIAKEAEIDPARLSKHLNGWLLLPQKHQKRLAEYLGLSLDEIAKNRIKYVPRGRAPGA